MTPLGILEAIAIGYLCYAVHRTLSLAVRNEDAIDSLRILAGSQATRSAAEFTAAEHERQLIDEDRERIRLMPTNAGRTDQHPLIR